MLGDEEARMPVEVQLPRRRFTRKEYHRMGKVGILKPNERVELIRGEIVEMSPIGPRHSAFVDTLNELLVTRLAGRAIVSVQNPVVLSDDSEPQPDLKLLRRRSYKQQTAETEDTLLLIEVAETSLAYDRSVKLRLYAEAGIPEYWVVDCLAESVEIHCAPTGTGYQDVTRVTDPAATVSPQAFPDIALSLGDIFV
jgi:Uma2 family endonuclease